MGFQLGGFVHLEASTTFNVRIVIFVHLKGFRLNHSFKVLP